MGLARSNAYANDPAYDALTGRVVGEYTVTRKGQGCTIITTYEVIDIGRADRVTAIDPDAAIADEPWARNMAGNRDSSAARAANRARGEASRAALRKLIADYLAAHGPAIPSVIAASIGVPYRAMSLRLLGDEGIDFVRVGRVIKASVWGLVGVHDEAGG